MSRIENIRFRLATDDDNENKSFAQISSGEINSTDGQPVPGGVCDLSLGTMDKKYKCDTCSNPRKTCLGHRGHIKLNTEIIIPMCVQDTVQWLKIICFDCGHLMIERERLLNATFTGSLLSTATGLLNDKPCPNCKTPHSKIIRDAEDYFTIWADNGTHKIKLYPEMIKKIFSKIHPDVLTIFKKTQATHPINFITKTLCVLPNSVRPPVHNFTGSSNTYHDFTNIIYHIVKRNILLSNITEETFKHLDKNGTISEENDRNIQIFQQNIHDMILGTSASNDKKRRITVGSKPFDSIMRKIQSKKGLLRNNLLGKRVIYMARSTISGNSSYRLDEVGLPLAIAQTLQVEETVQEYNYERLMGFFLNGKTYPGCSNIIKKSTGEYCDVSNIREKYLEIGDIVCRDVIDGDIAIFNRQPTLKGSSMGAHKIRIIKNDSVHTFQCNVLICKNYNADFDGDQMNLMVLHGVAARAEAKIINGVHTHFISEGTSAPQNGQDLDSIIGLYDLTRWFIKMDKYHAMAIYPDGVWEDKIYEGRDLISMALSKTPINYKKRPQSYKEMYACLNFHESEKMVEIENGKMLSGVLDKKSIGQGVIGSLFHIVSREYGKLEAFNSIYTFQQIALNFMMYNGFTMSTSDIILSREQMKDIHRVIANVLTESQVITDNLDNGLIIPPIGLSVTQYYEKQQINALKPNDGELMAYILKSMNTKTNGFLKMVASGSKGSDANFISICAAIGQITINEERITKNYCHDRVMVYCPRSATDPEFFGYCANSYMVGSNLIQFIHQARNLRFALIAKAILTAVTGTFLRKGIINHQNSIVDNNRRVTKDGKIVQFIYGEDGLNPKELEEVFISTIMMNDAQLAEYIGDDAEFYEKVKSERDEYRRLYSSFEKTVDSINFNNRILSPINVKRFIECVLLKSKTTSVSDAEWKKNIALVYQLCDKLPYLHLNSYLESIKSPYSAVEDNATWIYRVLIKSELTPKVLKRMTNQEVLFICDKIWQFYAKALIDYGTNVGSLAAQIICEPLTQGMLNSGHKSATGGSTKSGLIRFNEIYQVKNIEDEQTSIMSIPVDVKTEEDAGKIASSIEHVTLKIFLRECKIIVESFYKLRYTKTIGDVQWMEEFKKYKSPPTGDLTNWCFRLVIDKSILVLKNISLELIVEKLNRIQGIYLVHTPEIADEIVIRIWLRPSIKKSSSILDEEHVIKIKNEIIETPIRGSTRILRTQINKKNISTFADDGSIVMKERYIINTSGTNLYSVALHTNIIKTQLTSNSIVDTYRMFGIVAARNKIITESRLFLGEAVNDRHLQLYADEMTRTGKLTSLEAKGLAAREPTNILTRMSFANPIGVSSHAAINGIKSKVVGPGSNLMLGAIPQVGTYYNKLIINTAFTKENVKSLSSLVDDL